MTENRAPARRNPATVIVPEPTRETYVTAVDAAEAFVQTAALTKDDTLITAALAAKRAAWNALLDLEVTE